MLDCLVWSEEEYRLTDFVNKFTLPQLVRVKQGFHDSKGEDSTLGRGQVLAIHTIREADSVIAKDTNSRNVYIPKTCSQKVEVLKPGARNQNYYETVAELCKAFPKCVRVIPESKTQRLNLKRSYKLTLIGVTKRKGFLECENQNGVRICLPMNLQARFVPLQDGREYFVHEAMKSFKMPLLVEFIDSKCGTTSDTAPKVFNSSLGVLGLEQTLKEESIVCSTKDETTGKRYALIIPRDMNITVVAAQKAVDEDRDYVNFCDALKDEVELSKVDALEYENVYAPRHKIREYMQLQLADIHVYAKLNILKPLANDAHTSGCASLNVKYTEMIEKNPSNKNKIVKDEATGSQSALPLSQKNAIDLSSLSIEGVAELLINHHLGTFAEIFRNEEIDGRMLLELDKESFGNLGLNNFQAKKLLMLIHSWHPVTDS